MGRFEDLLDQVADGDASALETLRTEFGGTTLRDKAKTADDLQEKWDKNLPLIRQAALLALVSELGDDFEGHGLKAEDFGEFDPDTLTLDMVKNKAKSNLDAIQESKLSAAQSLGFDTVEAYEEAMATVKQQNDDRRSEMEKVGAGAVSNGGSPSGSDGGNEDVGREAFDAAKQEGSADDVALAKAIEAHLDRQLEEMGLPTE